MKNQQSATFSGKHIELFITVMSLGVSGGARGVIVIFVGNGHGDTSSNPGRD